MNTLPNRRAAFVSVIRESGLTPDFQDQLVAMIDRRAMWDDTKHAVMDRLAGYMDLFDYGGESYRALLTLVKRIKEIP
jgi:hypothetical protein